MTEAVELSAADLALLGHICDELRREEHEDAEAEAERRRENNRLKVRRHYHRRLVLMNDLRRQVSLLETQLTHLQRHQAVASITPIGVYRPPAADWQARLAALAELERLRAQLERENLDLRHFAAFTASSAPATARPTETPTAPLPPTLLLLRPVAPREVTALRELMLTQAVAFAAATGSFSRLGSVSGWEATMAEDAGRFNFLLRRPSIRKARPEDLLRATWALLSRGDRLRSLFSRRLGVACRVLQPLGGDTALALLQYSGRRVAVAAPGSQELDNTRDQSQELDVKTLFALAQFPGPRGDHTIVLRDVERRSLLLPSASDKLDQDGGEWADLFIWIRVERTADGSALSFGGAIPTLDARSPFWLTELMLVALRWEHAVLG